MEVWLQKLKKYSALILQLILTVQLVNVQTIEIQAYNPWDQGALTFGKDAFDPNYAVGFINITNSTKGPGVVQRQGGSYWKFGNDPYYLITNTSKRWDIYIDHYNQARYKGEYYDVREYVWVNTWEAAIRQTNGQAGSMDPPTKDNWLMREFHFYRSGTLAQGNPQEIQFQGIMQLQDLDWNEGYYVNNLNRAFLSEGTTITRWGTNEWRGTTQDGGTQQGQDKMLWVEVSGSPWNPLQLKYYIYGQHFSPINFEGTSYNGMVTYKPNGAPGNDMQQIIAMGPDFHTIISANPYVRSNYTFIGWCTDPNGNGTWYQPGQNVVFRNQLTVYAQWRANDYTVKFNGNGATSGWMGDQKIMYNVWTPLNKNQFNRQFTVTYDPNGGVTTGTSGTISQTFRNWQAGNNYYNDQQSVYNITGPGQTITLSAQWQDQTITLPNATREYYTFLGWYVDNTRIGGVGDRLLINRNYQLKAKWVPQQVLTVDPNGGDWLDKYPIVIGQYSQQAEIDRGPTNKTYKDRISFPMGPADQKKIEDAIRRGYNFYGWEISSMGKPS